MASRHARTLLRSGELGKLPLPPDPTPDPGDPKVRHSMKRDGDRLAAETR